ncbi:hypothetical protein BGX33_006278 [Mortierella sp. NVP41]|nr:hypothetical protein BGX33_006278 [Mortierella sp. NVP41]
MAILKNSKMMNLINFRLRITLADTRVLTGQMLAFDKHMNLVLADCEQFRRVKPKSGTTGTAAQEREQKRTLGLVILRGEIIVCMSVDAPPPPSIDGQKTRLSQVWTKEHSEVAHRIIVGRNRSSGACWAWHACCSRSTVGLTGPVRGVGGPTPRMMLPRGPAAAAPPMVYGRGMPPGGMPPPGMPPAGFRPMRMGVLSGGLPPGMPPSGMVPPPGVRPMGQPGIPPPDFHPGMVPPVFPPGFPHVPPPPGFQGPPPGFHPPLPPGYRPPQ